MNDICIQGSITVRDAIKRLDLTAKKILLVITDEEVLIGTVTDGDVRRWILKNGDFDVAVINIMNKNPITILDSDIDNYKSIMHKYSIQALPVIDSNKKVVDVLFWDDDYRELKFKDIDIKNPVVIMAGGKGTRLYPYTKVLPKPLIPIGDTTIMERIINRFLKYGCKNFYFTVNYKKI